MYDLPFDVIECSTELYQVGVSGRGRPKQDVPQQLRIGSAPRCECLNYGRGLGVDAETESGHQAL